VKIYRKTIHEEWKLIARGYARQVEIAEQVADYSISWTERHLVVRSLQQVEAAQTLIAAHQVEGLLILNFDETVRHRQVRRYRERPTRMVQEREPSVTVTIDENARQAVMRRKGWRVYATNAPAEELPLSQALLAFRNHYIVERGYDRLKCRPRLLTPNVFKTGRSRHRRDSAGLHRAARLDPAGIPRAASVGPGRRRVGWAVRGQSQAYYRPTAECILEAFKDRTLTLLHQPHRSSRHLTPLSELQQRILSLLDFPPDIYTQLPADSPKPS
jgi:hypothetical protein